MRQVLIGIWSVNTYGHGWYKLATDVKLGLLEKVVRKLEADATYQALAAGVPDGQIVGILAAPEYLFAQAVGGQGKQLTDESDRHLLDVTLKRLSFEHQHVLIFPGTIAFRETIASRGDARATLDLLRQHLGAMQAPTMNWHVRRLWRGQPIGDYAAQHQRDIDEHTAKIARFEGAVGRGLRKQTYYAARNTAFGFWRGNVVLAYHKRGEVGEVTDADAPIFFVNGNVPGTCTIDTVKFGVEVCKDATEGYLEGTGLRDVAVHMVLSASVETRDIRKVPGSVLVHACQIAAHSGITDEQDRVVDAVRSTRVAGAPLDFFDVTIP